jgi:UcrQ family protein
VTTAISPWQTKAAPHWMRNYLFNGYRRISGELIFFGIPFAIGASRDALRYYFCKPIHLQDMRRILGQRVTMSIRTAKPDISPQVHIIE